MAAMVAENAAAYEPIKQTRSVVLFWQSPEEWGEIMHEWVSFFHLLNTRHMFSSYSYTGTINGTTWHDPDLL